MSKNETPVEPIYPYSPWEVIEPRFEVANNYRNETIFALANGYLGMRGNFEEGYNGPPRTGLEGTYINGFYESEPIKYPEAAYGFAERSQTMLNVTNGKIIQLLVEDEPFDMLEGEVLQYQRALRLKEGVLERKLIWRSPQGREAEIEIVRLVSLVEKHLAAISYSVTPLNFDGKITLVSTLNGDVTNLTAENDPRLGSGLESRVLSVEDKALDGDFGALVQRTKNTRFLLACVMDHQIKTKSQFTSDTAAEPLAVNISYHFDAHKGEPVHLTKYLAYTTSRDYPEADVLTTAKEVVTKAKAQGFDSLCQEQADFLSKFWERADIEVKGDLALQQGIRFNMFHLLQSVGRDGHTAIGAKGLTGEGYEGHYFWDTEMYIAPFFLYNSPDITRKLLEYRYNILDKARARARQMSHKTGALFPWRTIDGDECSAYFPAGTAQYHIDADITYAIRKYMEVTDDTDFLISYGAEIVFETARLWADLGDFIEHKGNKFCINCVTGPDEYNALVDNNCYTNLMAKENLLYGCEIARLMKTRMPDVYQTLAAKINLAEYELAFWQKAADNMYMPYDEQLQIHKQDDHFLDKTRWDFANTPPENYPLLIHYHPLVIYRYQVSKQADLVLALFLLGHKFTPEEKKRDYDYYEQITTHDSSLSTCIFSIVASEIGYHDKAYRYFMNTARMDLDDTHHNVNAGIHAANMAGTWMCLVNGFAGMRSYGDVLSFRPALPQAWEEYTFRIMYRGNLLRVTIGTENVHYTLLSGSNLSILHNGQSLELTEEGQSIDCARSDPALNQ